MQSLCLHVMDEKMLNDILIGKWKWILYVIFFCWIWEFMISIFIFLFICEGIYYTTWKSLVYIYEYIF